jgi:hypothetical protein
MYILKTLVENWVTLMQKRDSQDPERGKCIQNHSVVLTYFQSPRNWPTPYPENEIINILITFIFLNSLLTRQYIYFIEITQ